MTFRKKGVAGLVVISILFIVIIFIFVLFSMIGKNLLNNITPTLREEFNNTNDTMAISSINNIDNRFSNLFEGIGIFLFIMLWAACLVVAFISNDHPILFVFLILILIIVTVISGYISNAYVDISNSFQTEKVSMPIQDFIMSHLMLITAGVLVSSLGVCYAKNKFD